MTACKGTPPRKTEAEVIAEAAQATAERLIAQAGPLPDSIIRKLQRSARQQQDLDPA